MNKQPNPASKGGTSAWKYVALCLVAIMIPWALYINSRPAFQSSDPSSQAQGPGGKPILSLEAINRLHGADSSTATTTTTSVSKPSTVAPVLAVVPSKKLEFPQLPVQGPIPTNGVAPLFGVKHKGTDAIMALACNYPKVYYQRFVGSLRKFGYDEDIVLAVSPIEKMKPGVENYLKETNVVAYGFDVDCQGPDNCKLKDDFLGYPDPRPYRTFANIRYALYEYWLRHYSENSYVLILDFRDTFFQANPFQLYGSYSSRKEPKYELHMYAENYEVKNIGICVFNSMWIKVCFGKDALQKLKQNPVICSGSTLGSYPAVHHYVRTMLQSMDSVKCWLKGIESDQGYQNYLFYNGHFNTAMGNATLFQQGYGVVNTIGAMNGFR